MRKIILLLAAGLLLLAGCSDIVQQENDTDSSSGGTAGAFLRVTAETEGFGAQEEEASARTALPTIDGSAVTDSFTYTLKGTKEGGSEETLVSGVSLVVLKESLIPVTTGKWSFTLKAEKDGTVFTGTLSDKTITAGDNELSFTISWDESALSGKGSLAFSLDWSKAGLNSVEAAAGTLFAYDPDTGTETATAYTEASGGITLDKDAHTVTYSLSNVPAGVYVIKISFYSDAEKKSLAGTWRELAVITGGQKSGASRVMNVFVKHAATIDPKTDGGLSGITQKTSSVEGIVTLTENTDGTYTLTSQGMGTSVLTFSETKDGESVAVTYNVSVSDTGELTVGSPKVVYSVTVAGGIEHGTVTAEPAPAAAGETVTLTVTYAGAIAIKNANDEDISSLVSLSQDSEDTTKWTFIMPEGTVTVSAIFEDTEPFTTTLKTGDAINSILKSLCAGSACTKFARSETNKDEATLYLDTEGKYIPVWSVDTEVYYYVPDGCTPVMNEDSSGMFYACKGLTSLDVTGFDTSNVTDMSYMFEGCSDLTSLDVSKFDTSNVTDMSYMFEGCSDLTSLDVSKFVTSKVENMSGMFEGCSGLTSLDVSSFDTSKVTNMEDMFSYCYRLTTIYATDKFVTTSVTYGDYCFDLCSMLEGGAGTTYDETSATYARIDGGTDAPGYFTAKATTITTTLKTGSDIHSILGQLCGDFSACTKFARSETNNASATLYLDTEGKYIPVWSAGTEVYYYVPDGCTPVMNEDSSDMFYGCSGLTSLDVTGFDTSKVTNMYDMFSGCSGLTSLDLSSFDTSKVKDMSDMFSDCSGLTSLDLSSFDTSNVTNMESMFSGCEELRTIYATGKFVTTSVTDGGLYCFDQCSKLVGGAGTIFDASDNGKTLAVPYARIDGGTDAPGYFTQPIGSKSKPDAVGDIVFSDGSATPYTADLTLTEEQKSKAVAVIFYAGSASDTLGAKTLGVGLKNATGGSNNLAWAKNGDTDITAIQCKPSSEEAATAKFTGDLDGSDNWKALCDAVNDEDTSGNYPAWEWVNAYATTTANLTGDYASGWYLPTVAELSMLYRVKATVNSALEKASGTKIADAAYWSSSQNASNYSTAWEVWFGNNYLLDEDKNKTRSVCAVRAF